MEREYHIKIYSTQKSQQPKMSFVQYDTEVSKIAFEFYNTAKEINDDIVIATATIERFDGKSYTYGMNDASGNPILTIESNLVTFILPLSALSVVGKCYFSVSVYDGEGGKLTTQTFSYEVTKALESSTPIEEATEYPVLTQLIRDVQKLKEMIELGNTGTNVTKLNQLLDDAEHRLVTDARMAVWDSKVDGMHYHGMDMVTGLMEKLNSIDSKITDLYSHINVSEPIPVEILSIDEIAGITVPFGTVLSSVTLPAMAWVTLTDNSREQRSVAWSGGSLASDTEVGKEYIYIGTINKTALKASISVIVSAEVVTPTEPTIITSDNFDRADNATTLGSPWVIQNNSTWGISGNQAYLVAVGTGGSSVAVQETSKSDIVIEADVLYNSAQSIYNTGLAFRSTNNTNYFDAILLNGITLRKYVSGTATTLGNYALTLVNGTIYKIKVIANGSSIKVFVNDIERISVTDSFNLTATLHGLRTWATKGYWDNFKITNIAEAPPVVVVNDVVAMGAVADGITDDSAYFSISDGNYIQSGKTVALTKEKFRTIPTTFTGDGKLKVLGMPYLPMPSHPQGIVYPKDMSDRILMDMNLPNEAIPYSAQSRQKVSGWYSFDDVSVQSWVAIMDPWAQIFLKEGSSWVNGSYVYLENLTLLVFRNSTQRWEILGTSTNGEADIMGKWFDADYSENGSIPTLEAVYTKTTNGIRLTVDSSMGARCFHYWLPHLSQFRSSIVPSDFKWLVAYVDVYTDSDVANNTMVADVGIDTWSAGNSQIREIGGGRFINVTKTKRRCYVTSLDYNNYFTYCNQQLIDSLK